MAKATTRRDAVPLRPEEIIELRRMLRRALVLEPGVDAREAARVLGLKPRAVLNKIRAGEFPGAWKPSHNRVRIPLEALESYKRKREVAA